MIVVEIYGFEDNQRTQYTREFPGVDSWERDLMMRKLAGTWVGHRIYQDLSMRQWAQMPSEERQFLNPECEFDREAYILHRQNAGKQFLKNSNALHRDSINTLHKE